MHILNREKCILFLLLVIFVLIPAYSLPSMARGANDNDHNTDIGAIIYKAPNWKEMKKKDQNTLLSYYILSDAAYFAIDYPVGRRDDVYPELQDNINRTRNKFVLPPLQILYFSTWGGKHRMYNHQGFYFNYEEAQKTGKLKTDAQTASSRMNRWLIGRDQVLIPAAASAFGLALNNPKSEIIALFAYYAHMIGDVFHGDTKDMSKIKSFRGLCAEFERECDFAFSKGNTTKPNSLQYLYEELREKRENMDDSSLYPVYLDIKNIMGIYIPQIIQEMGINVNNI